MLSVTYGYARVSKADSEAKNLETQLKRLREFGIRDDHIFADIGTGRSLKRPQWETLMAKLHPGDILAVTYMDRISRNFDDMVVTQRDLLDRGVHIVALEEDIDTRDTNPEAKAQRRLLMVMGAYQVETTQLRIKQGLERARAMGRTGGRPPSLTPDKVALCDRLEREGRSLRELGRMMGCSANTVQRAINILRKAQADEEEAGQVPLEV